MTRQQAIKADAMLYVGKACGRHPELKGQRRVKSRNCPKCLAARFKATRDKKKALGVNTKSGTRTRVTGAGSSR